jgi:hypothetical protein
MSYTPEEVKEYENQLMLLKVFNNMKFNKTSDFSKYIENQKKEASINVDSVKDVAGQLNMRDNPAVLKAVTDINNSMEKSMDALAKLMFYLRDNGRLTDDI